MYEEKMGSVPKTQEEHISIAEQMGKEIASNFNPDQQNDMIRRVRNIVLERRQLEIEETEKRLAYLKDTFQQL